MSKIKYLLPIIGAFLLSLVFRKKTKPLPDNAELKEAKLEVVDANKKKQQAEAQADIDADNSKSLDDWLKSELEQGGDEPA